MKVTHAGRLITVEVTPDGAGLVSHAGSALLAGVAEKTGLRRALSIGLGGVRQRRGRHDPGRVITELAVMLADGGDCLADLQAMRDQAPLFGQVASASTAFRLVDAIASDPDGLERLRCAHARARSRAWKSDRRSEQADDRPRRDADHQPLRQGGRGRDLQGRLRLSPDARLRRSDRRGAGRRTAARQRRLQHRRRPDRGRRTRDSEDPGRAHRSDELLLRVDSAGATHELLDRAREGRIRYSVGYDLTDQVRAAILKTADSAWVAAVDQDGTERPNGQVAEITKHLDLAAWPRVRG